MRRCIGVLDPGESFDVLVVWYGEIEFYLESFDCLLAWDQSSTRLGGRREAGGEEREAGHGGKDRVSRW